MLNNKLVLSAFSRRNIDPIKTLLLGYKSKNQSKQSFFIKGDWYIAAYGTSSDIATFYAKPNISNINMFIRIELEG